MMPHKVIINNKPQIDPSNLQLHNICITGKGHFLFSGKKLISHRRYIALPLMKQQLLRCSKKSPIDI